MGRVFVIVLLLYCTSINAQFTYFNQITGAQDDLESESTANVEVIEDGYVIWGAGVDDGELFHFLRKYDLLGSIVNENQTLFPNEYLFSGIINSFQYNGFTEQFVMLQGSDVGDGIVLGRMLVFNSGLELVNDLSFDTYNPYTYFFGFHIEEDGYTIIGEYGSALNVQATFIMKLDFEGNILWTEILQEEVIQHIYRNWGVLKLDSGYLVSGLGRISSTPFGLLTITDQYGIVLQTIEFVDPELPRSLGMSATRLDNGEILIGQLFGYEWVPDFGNPNIFWNKLRLSKLDEESLDTTGVIEHFDNFEFFYGGVNDMVATPDGGAIILGSHLGYFFDATAWMLKVDSDGNEEWYQEYTYETCNDCTNILYDIELTADGGYIAAGQFSNFAIDPRNSTWLVKVDACGDLEWQGCEPLNTDQEEANSFRVYPNPSNGHFTVSTESQERLKSWRLFDLSGRLIAQESLLNGLSELVMDLSLPTGLYSLQLELEDGSFESQKLQVIR